jgi:triosephosphate isomerase
MNIGGGLSVTTTQSVALLKHEHVQKMSEWRLESTFVQVRVYCGGSMNHRDLPEVESARAVHPTFCPSAAVNDLDGFTSAKALEKFGGGAGRRHV